MRIWGILNVTPDSFSDGGRVKDAEAAVEAGRALIEAGADVLDVGGESTRPGADPVPIEDEIARVVPVIEGLRGAGREISIDTRHARVAEAALDAGAAIVNDVSAGRDPDMFALVAGRGAQMVLMHMQGEPRTMQRAPHYEDVVSEVSAWLEDRLTAATEAGIPAGHVYLDPGIGFGKTTAHNLALLNDLAGLVGRHGTRGVLLGASRKRFLGELTGREVPTERLAASLACVAWAWMAGVGDVRVHDVAETRDLIATLDAIDAG